MSIRRLAIRTGVALFAALLIFLRWGWEFAGMTYRPLFFRDDPATELVGCWRLFDGRWVPQESRYWSTPSIARLDSTPADTERVGRSFRATRLDSTGASMDTSRRHRHRGYWGVTAVTGTVWVYFTTGLHGQAYRFPSRGAGRDTMRGSIGEFSDFPPHFSRRGGTHAVRVPCTPAQR